MADLFRSAGRVGEAEQLSRQGLVIVEELAAAEPANTGFQRELSVSYDQLADLALSAGRVGEAERLYRQGLVIAEELAAAEPANTGFRRDLSVSYDQLAGLALSAGRSGRLSGSTGRAWSSPRGWRPPNRPTPGSGAT